MNFSSASRKWTVSNGDFEPQVLITIFLQSVAKHLPGEALGHAKIYVEFEGGAAFGSSTLIPDELHIQTTGTFTEGDVWIGATLIFGDVERRILLAALEIAQHDVETKLKCRMLTPGDMNHET